MANVKRVTLHPLKEDGQIDYNTNIYPKTLIDGVVDRDGHQVEIPTTEEMREELQVGLEGKVDKNANIDLNGHTLTTYINGENSTRSSELCPDYFETHNEYENEETGEYTFDGTFYKYDSIEYTHQGEGVRKHSTLSFPKLNGGYGTLAISVNGTSADETGNITIPEPGTKLYKHTFRYISDDSTKEIKFSFINNVSSEYSALAMAVGYNLRDAVASSAIIYECDNPDIDESKNRYTYYGKLVEAHGIDVQGKSTFYYYKNGQIITYVCTGTRVIQNSVEEY